MSTKREVTCCPVCGEVDAREIVTITQHEHLHPDETRCVVICDTCSCVSPVGVIEDFRAFIRDCVDQLEW